MNIDVDHVEVVFLDAEGNVQDCLDADSYDYDEQTKTMYVRIREEN